MGAAPECAGQRTLVVTGASGFIGRHLCRGARARGWRVITLARDGSGLVPDTERLPIGSLTEPPERLAAGLERSLQPGEASRAAMIHLAGRAHVMQESNADPAAEYVRANVTSAVHAARAARLSGIGRFVFVSSIGAVGESTDGTPLDEAMSCAPSTPYGQSKLAAEEALRAEGLRELVIVRPPLVHGRGAPGNIARLAALVRSGLPVPLGSVRNQRSLIHVDNLVDALLLCSQSPRSPGRTFHVRDRSDYSTPELVRLTGIALGRRPWLLPVPVSWLRFAGATLGIKEAIDRLIGSLRVNDELIRRTLDWMPRDLPFEV